MRSAGHAPRIYFRRVRNGAHGPADPEAPLPMSLAGALGQGEAISRSSPMSAIASWQTVRMSRACWDASDGLG